MFEMRYIFYRIETISVQDSLIRFIGFSNYGTTAVVINLIIIHLYKRKVSNVAVEYVKFQNHQKHVNASTSVDISLSCKTIFLIEP